MFPGVGPLVDSGFILGDTSFYNFVRGGHIAAREAISKVNDYLATMSPPPSNLPSKMLSFEIEFSSPRPPLPGPEWLARGISNANWDTFTEHLREYKETAAQVVLGQWNSSFFASRGCRVVMKGVPSSTDNNPQQRGDAMRPEGDGGSKD